MDRNSCRQGHGGPLYATTRAQWKELKGSYDDVRDIFVSTSRARRLLVQSGQGP